MAETNRFNIQVSNMNKPGSRKGKGPQRAKTRLPTLEEVHQWLYSLGLEKELTAELIKKVNKYPLEAMDRFRSKINFHIGEIQRK